MANNPILSNRFLSGIDNVQYSQIDLTSKIQNGDIDPLNKITEAKLALDNPTHPENSTLSLEENLLVNYETLAPTFPGAFTMSLQSLLTGVPNGNSTTEGVIVDKANNLCVLLNATGERPKNDVSFIYGRITSKRITAQPTNITGVTVAFVDSDNTSDTLSYTTGSVELSWGGGAGQGVSSGGYFKLTSSTGKSIWVNVNFGSLPVANQSDNLTFTSEYILGVFRLHEDDTEQPATLAGVHTIYYPRVRSLQTKSYLSLEKSLMASFTKRTTAIPKRIQFISGAGDTTFDLNQSFMSDSETIHLNEVFMIPNTDYTISGTEIILTNPAALNDVLTASFWV